VNYLKVVLILVTTYLSGCVSNQSGFVVPGESLVPSARYYVVKARDDERSLNEVIVRNLLAKGYSVSTGLREETPKAADYLINYGSQWQWDITWYLLDFDIRIYTHANNLFVASAHSEQTSLLRKPQDEIVASVINRIFVD